MEGSTFAASVISLSDSEPEDLFLNPIQIADQPKKVIPRKRQRNLNSTPKQSKKQMIENIFECAVCLSNIRDKRMGNPSSCQHNFCVDCIKRWAKDNTTCPLDRMTFEWINILDRSSGDLVMKINKEGKRIMENPCDRTGSICSLCSSSHDPKMMVSCDRCETKNHIECLTNFESVSVYSWLCEVCEAFGTSEINENIRRLNSAERGLALQRYRIHLHAKSMIRSRPKNNTPNDFGSAPLQATVQEILALPSPQHEPQDLLLEIMRSQETMFRERISGGIGKSAEPIPQTSSAAFPSSSVAPSSSKSLSSSAVKSNEGGRLRLLTIEKIAKDILKPYVYSNAITKDKAKQILKIVVPKVCKETSPSIDPHVLRQMIQEKVLIWLDIL